MLSQLDPLCTDALYTNDAIRAFERDLFKAKLADPMQLMQTAGQASFALLQRQWPNARSLVVFCGAGNNGGDGFVLARLAKEQDFNVIIYSIKNFEDLSGLAQETAKACKALNISIHFWENQTIDFTKIDVIIDALLGSGLEGIVKGTFETAIDSINQSTKPVLAIDIPSGLNANTGAIQGKTVKANNTITFIGLKQGLFTDDGAEYCGKIGCHTLNIPKQYYKKINPTAYLFNKKILKKFLKTRPRTANKGCYGHVLVVGGDYGMAGAIRMAAEATLRVGAGLVSVATHAEHRCIVNAECPEIMCHAIKTGKDLQPLIEKATVIIAGPGLGQTNWSIALLTECLKAQSKPLLLDADALNLISTKINVTYFKIIKRLILTPHPGEAGRLLDISTKTIQKNRFDAITQLQQKYHATVVLKGAGTLIKSEKALPIICTQGNPGMATAGMGDVLSGVIGGLLAQGISDFDAAQIGVYLHAQAADMAAAEYGERGLIATDLFHFLQKLSNITP